MTQRSRKFFACAAAFLVSLFVGGFAGSAFCADAPVAKAASATSSKENGASIQKESKDLVENFFKEGLGILNKDSLSAAQKKKQFGVLLSKVVDVPSIANFCLGAYVDLPDAGQKERYHKLFLKFAENVFVLRLTPYRQAEMSIRNVEYENDGTDRVEINVISKITARNLQEPVSVRWLVERVSVGNEAKYRILDLEVNGISLAQEQRGAFTSFLSANGGDFEAFLESISQKVGVKSSASH